MKHFSKGFTIIELIVVIAIIAILAAIVIVNVVGYIQSAKETALKQDLLALQTDAIAAGINNTNGYTYICQNNSADSSMAPTYSAWQTITSNSLVSSSACVGNGGADGFCVFVRDASNSDYYCIDANNTGITVNDGSRELCNGWNCN